MFISINHYNRKGNIITQKEYHQYVKLYNRTTDHVGHILFIKANRILLYKKKKQNYRQEAASRLQYLSTLLEPSKGITNAY